MKHKANSIYHIFLLTFSIVKVIIIKTLKSFKLKYLGLESFNKAIVTKGGIDVKELNPQTMEVKKISGLFFVGEVIDVDAFTGGFNMQIALSTGFACGKSI